MTLESIQKKISKLSDIVSITENWKKTGNTLVFTNGCFDIMHPGHIVYLSEAADMGDKLIIGLNSDKSVRSIKGKNRPILDENARALLLAAMTFVNAVVLFDDDTPYKLIDTIKPDVLVKGKEYKINEIVGSDLVLGYGGIVKTVEMLPGYSTSLIEKRIVEGLNK